MKIKNILILLLLATNLSFSQSNGFVSIKGRNIVKPDGTPVFLKGINLGNWLVPEGYMFKFENANSPRLINEVISQLIGPDEAISFWNKFRENYITKDDIVFIKSLGMNSIRVPFDYRLFTPEQYPDISLTTGFELLDKVIKWSEEAGLYVVLDMHCAPGGQTGDNIDNSWGFPFLFTDVKSQDRFIEVWKRIAERYKDNKTVIGYDFLNEPIATYFNAEELNPHLEPLYKRVTTAVREVDKNHLLFPGGAQWNNNFTVFGPPFDSKLVYNFHKYWCDTTQSEIQQYLDFREKYNVPLWMSESGENTDEWIAGWRRMMERNDIHWCFWPYKKMDAKSCLVQFDIPEGFSAIIDFSKADRSSYEKIRKERPDVKAVKKALEKFLENCKFRNCKPNASYINALGMKLE